MVVMVDHGVLPTRYAFVYCSTIRTLFAHTQTIDLATYVHL